ncbi:primosomal protein N' [Mastigocoleus testarum]|uniref:Replication restart protein PriA n=1 Tax=Mastigocoleus testarum BC008 TaxID=371196 RepID=A0A0V7ZQX0_9CYAN|nr:primosomal protein N' [Mastigocoleus testarum]KST66995.1 primosomal protein N' [Mastigocoleus testarum BC008]KST67116.1 primosomal protein N' [Mastigocoleus testarum BC008]
MYIQDTTLSSKVVAQNSEDYKIDRGKNEWVEVLVDCPGAMGIFTYRLPSHLQVKAGDILSVPFGTQIVGGIAVRLLFMPNIDLPKEKIRNIEDIVSVGFFPKFYWQLLNRVAAYYYTPLIQVIRVSLPPGLLGRSQRRIRLIRKQKKVDLEQVNLEIINPETINQKRVNLERINPKQVSWEQKTENSHLDSSNSNEQELLLSDILPFLSLPAQKILQLLQAQTAGDYSFVYLQRQVRGASRGVKELIRRGLVESYLEPPRLARPKLQKAVILINDLSENELTSRQQEILAVLRRRGGELWQTELLQACHTSTSTLKKLAQKGCILIEERERLRTEHSPQTGEDLTGEQVKSLTPAQSTALATIQELNGYAKVLLHGVTGSGKTEVYLQAIAPLLVEGKSALVLVPEIGLTPQLTDRFRARFGNKVFVYHSALSEGERYDTWRQMLTGEPSVVIGTRSAVFAPLPNLGLIILDEEHDSSFKQDSPAPTYHARVVAQWRAELEGFPLVLGSATPSLESLISAIGEQGDWKQGNNKTHYLSLPKRVYSRPLPPIKIVDMRLELQQGNRSIFSKPLKAALLNLQEKRQQGILFIHRRGHSTFVSCRSCGYVLDCPNCDVSLSYHHTEPGAQKLLRCHYCNYGCAHPPNCPECGSPYLKFFGSGTQKVAQELSRQFPELRFIRFDSDTTRRKGAHRQLLSKFANGEAELLIGTQMLTKGLDLPQVTLVGVVAADGLLHLSDYRASERAFQTLTQVAGRAGRGEDPGQVIIQTYNPDHQVIEAVQNHDYQSFTNTELEQRQVLNYPPYGRLILLRLSSPEEIQVQKTAQAIAAVLKSGSGFDVLGPAPANVLRVANRFRWQILIKFAPDALPQLPNWEEIRQLCPQIVSLTIDVDPLNMM